MACLPVDRITPSLTSAGTWGYKVYDKAHRKYDSPAPHPGFDAHWGSSYSNTSTGGYSEVGYYPQWNNPNLSLAAQQQAQQEQEAEGDPPLLHWDRTYFDPRAPEHVDTQLLVQENPQPPVTAQPSAETIRVPTNADRALLRQMMQGRGVHPVEAQLAVPNEVPPELGSAIALPLHVSQAVGGVVTAVGGVLGEAPSAGASTVLVVGGIWNAGRGIDGAQADFRALLFDGDGVPLNEQLLGTTAPFLIDLATGLAVVATPKQIKLSQAANVDAQFAQKTPLAQARELGLAGEEAVGITGPKTGIRILGSNQVRIPGAINFETKILSEVKNVASQSYTQQLRDFAAFAQQNGLTFELYVRPSTRLSGPLLEAIRRGEIILRYIPGTQ